MSCPQGSWSNGGTSAPSGFSGNNLEDSNSDQKDTDDAGNGKGEDEKSGDREGDDKVMMTIQIMRILMIQQMVA